ncbi:hypothetical protein KBTX_02469 [wastewater metagenome]|uniref:Uncharacterized protein n=2 Tax=unclassified sequences TaxID=12908 RepID=A0A5B8RAA8_9ZZZZ|nr:hypothetical protein [Arhodomonas sp. KWT]QEA06139.1 hypothetical protein KBTEX_02469 [uncultured organism]
MTATIETWWTKRRVHGPAVPVQVAKVPGGPRSTGEIVSTARGEELVLLSERRVRHPDPGCRYFEFRYRQR